MDPMSFISCNRTSPNETYVYFPLLSKVDMYSVNSVLVMIHYLYLQIQDASLNGIMRAQNIHLVLEVSTTMTKKVNIQILHYFQVSSFYYVLSSNIDLASHLNKYVPYTL